MWIALALVAALFLWLGVDALLLGRHASPPGPIEKDEMMFGKGHKRPVSAWFRAFAERRYPVASRGSTQVYAWLFIVVGVFLALGAWGVRNG